MGCLAKQQVFTDADLSLKTRALPFADRSEFPLASATCESHEGEHLQSALPKGAFHACAPRHAFSAVEQINALYCKR